MTRFIMSLEEAVDLVLFAFEHGQNGDILVQKAPACTIQTQAEAICELFGSKKENIKVIGIRHGEKMYETLLTNEECAKAEDMATSIEYLPTTVHLTMISFSQKVMLSDVCCLSLTQTTHIA